MQIKKSMYAKGRRKIKTKNDENKKSKKIKQKSFKSY